MGVINDIAYVIVPNAKERIKNEGISSKEALYIEFKKVGYIPNIENAVKEVKR